ncbi:NAD(P)-binding protein [Nakamurella sp. YIM 132087]|uniref:NAD(P)-binding protein n=1 Tax=Nakamurella alba TaxID=2665158 RepID=A0A7K1FSZ4_9ACTN|nr:NAD(P)-binding protein [Nakamurella alba]MTD17276.1 NAD(P)-binding protein [Nakamurella alba]
MPADSTTPAFARPLDIGPLHLRNRLVATAHGTAAVADGIPTAEDARYWGRLAAGGVGMAITGGMSVAKESTYRNRFLTEAWRPEAIGGMAGRAGAIRAGGAVAVAQICHLGRETLGANLFHSFVGPSDVLSPREQTSTRVLRTDEVPGIVEAFVASARNCAAAGFDGVELHGAHGYLLAQFLSRTVNTRTDRYGGSAAGRVTLVVEIIEGIRRAVPGLPVGLRVSVENDAGGSGLEDFGELLPLIQQRAPFDYLNLTYGMRGYYVRDMATEQPLLLGHSAALRDAVGVPLLLCSMFRDPAQVEQALATGADMVGMARPYIADPDLPTKFLAGRSDEVRPCVSCNEDCRSFDPTALCTVNPDLAPAGSDVRPASPLLLPLGPTRSNGTHPGRRIAVVGAGPAGVECALSLADRGFVPELFEAGDRIGGAIAVAAGTVSRHGWQRLLRFYDAGLRRSDIPVRYRTTVAPADLEGFDAVVLACGAAEDGPVTQPGAIPASSSTDYLADPPMVAGTVLIQDDGFGWWPTVSAVEAALDRGASSVVLLTPGGSFAGSIPPESRLQLMERLRGRPLDIRPLTAVVGTTGDGVVVRHTLTGAEQPLAGDLLVAIGRRRPRDLPTPAGIPTWVIGDAVAPRRVSNAIAEGRAAAATVARAIAVPALV